MAWVVIVVSALVDIGYYGAEVPAYQAGDLSLAYPLSRGSAPLFLSLWGIALLREKAIWHGVAGIVLIVAGLYTVNLPRLGDWAAPFLALGSAAAGRSFVYSQPARSCRQAPRP